MISDTHSPSPRDSPFHAYVTEVLTLFDENGGECSFRILDRLVQDGKRYLALIRMDRGVGQTLIHFLEELPNGEYDPVFQREQYESLFQLFCERNGDP